jgi:putative ABC transport system permease protein
MPILANPLRSARRARWVDGLRGDVHFAFRYFARHKATTVIIVVVLALGTGANSLIFSMFQAQFIRPAPAVPKISTHARIWAQQRNTRTAAWQPRQFSGSELEAIAKRRDVFQDVAAWTEDEVILQGGDSTEARGVNAQFVTSNYFRTAGVRLVAGQGFGQTAADTPDMTAVIAYAMAEQIYGEAVQAVGRRILVNEVPMRVVGVAPPRFQGAVRDMDEPALWMPLSARTDVERISPRWLTDESSLAIFARLGPGASLDQATALTRQVIASALPDSAARVGMARTASVTALNAPPPGAATEEVMLAFTLIMTIGIIILLVAWMNVSSLMVAAAVGRRHEIAVRLSLGASRLRVLRQLVTESTVLAVSGSALGLTAAWWVLTWMMKTEIDAVDLTPDLGTFSFVLIMAVVTGILFGLSPALHATRGGVSNALRDSGTGASSRSRLQRGFVVAQIALSQPLLVLLGTLLSLVIADYQPMSADMSRHVIKATFRPLASAAPGQRLEAVDSLIPRIAQRPEVLAAVPETNGVDVRGVFAVDRASRSAATDTVPTIVVLEGAAPGWFGVVDVPIVLGRDLSYADTAATDWPVVIGSDLARALWGEATPLGRTLVSPPLSGLKQDSTWLTVVGVYDAARSLPGMSFMGQPVRGSMSSSQARVYTARGKPWDRHSVLVRTRGPAAPFVPHLQRFVRNQSPSLPVTSMITLAQMDEGKYHDTLRMTALAGAGGAAALLLASLGLYGVVSLAVRQRTREIGIRIAVGAHPMRVARMFLKSGIRASVVALAIGLPLSIAALKVGLSRGLVLAPNVNPYLIGIVIAAILVAVASAATWMPARRAALVNPARTLRAE